MFHIIVPSLSENKGKSNNFGKDQPVMHHGFGMVPPPPPPLPPPLFVMRPLSTDEQLQSATINFIIKSRDVMRSFPSAEGCRLRSLPSIPHVEKVTALLATLLCERCLVGCDGCAPPSYFAVHQSCFPSSEPRGATLGHDPSTALGDCIATATAQISFAGLDVFHWPDASNDEADETKLCLEIHEKMLAAVFCDPQVLDAIHRAAAAVNGFSVVSAVFIPSLLNLTSTFAVWLLGVAPPGVLSHLSPLSKLIVASLVGFGRLMDVAAETLELTLDNFDKSNEAGEELTIDAVTALNCLRRMHSAMDSVTLVLKKYVAATAVRQEGTEGVFIPRAIASLLEVSYRLSRVGSRLVRAVVTSEIGCFVITPSQEGGKKRSSCASGQQVKGQTTHHLVALLSKHSGFVSSFASLLCEPAGVSTDNVTTIFDVLCGALRGSDVRKKSNIFVPMIAPTHCSTDAARKGAMGHDVHDLFLSDLELLAVFLPEIAFQLVHCGTLPAAHSSFHFCEGSAATLCTAATACWRIVCRAQELTGRVPQVLGAMKSRIVDATASWSNFCLLVSGFGATSSSETEGLVTPVIYAMHNAAARLLPNLLENEVTEQLLSWICGSTADTSLHKGALRFQTGNLLRGSRLCASLFSVATTIRCLWSRPIAKLQELTNRLHELEGSDSGTAPRPDGLLNAAVGLSIGIASRQEKLIVERKALSFECNRSFKALGSLLRALCGSSAVSCCALDEGECDETSTTAATSTTPRASASAPQNFLSSLLKRAEKFLQASGTSVATPTGALNAQCTVEARLTTLLSGIASQYSAAVDVVVAILRSPIFFPQHSAPSSDECSKSFIVLAGRFFLIGSKLLWSSTQANSFSQLRCSVAWRVQICHSMRCIQDCSITQSDENTLFHLHDALWSRSEVMFLLDCALAPVAAGLQRDEADPKLHKKGTSLKQSKSALESCFDDIFHKSLFMLDVLRLANPSMLSSMIRAATCQQADDAAKPAEPSGSGEMAEDVESQPKCEAAAVLQLFSAVWSPCSAIRRSAVSLLRTVLRSDKEILSVARILFQAVAQAKDKRDHQRKRQGPSNKKRKVPTSSAEGAPTERSRHVSELLVALMQMLHSLLFKAATPHEMDKMFVTLVALTLRGPDSCTPDDEVVRNIVFPSNVAVAQFPGHGATVVETSRRIAQLLTEAFVIEKCSPSQVAITAAIDPLPTGGSLRAQDILAYFLNVVMFLSQSLCGLDAMKYSSKQRVFLHSDSKTVKERSVGEGSNVAAMSCWRGTALVVGIFSQLDKYSMESVLSLRHEDTSSKYIRQQLLRVLCPARSIALELAQACADVMRPTPSASRVDVCHMLGSYEEVEATTLRLAFARMQDLRSYCGGLVGAQQQSDTNAQSELIGPMIRERCVAFREILHAAMHSLRSLWFASDKSVATGVPEGNFALLDRLWAAMITPLTAALEASGTGDKCSKPRNPSVDAPSEKIWAWCSYVPKFIDNMLACLKSVNQRDWPRVLQDIIQNRDSFFLSASLSPESILSPKIVAIIFVLCDPIAVELLVSLATSAFAVSLLHEHEMIEWFDFLHQLLVPSVSLLRDLIHVSSPHSKKSVAPRKLQLAVGASASSVKLIVDLEILRSEDVARLHLHLTRCMGVRKCSGTDKGTVAANKEHVVKIRCQKGHTITMELRPCVHRSSLCVLAGIAHLWKNRLQRLQNRGSSEADNSEPAAPTMRTGEISPSKAASVFAGDAMRSEVVHSMIDTLLVDSDDDEVTNPTTNVESEQQSIAAGQSNTMRLLAKMIDVDVPLMLDSALSTGELSACNATALLLESSPCGSNIVQRTVPIDDELLLLHRFLIGSTIRWGTSALDSSVMGLADLREEFESLSKLTECATAPHSQKHQSSNCDIATRLRGLALNQVMWISRCCLRGDALAACGADSNAAAAQPLLHLTKELLCVTSKLSAMMDASFVEATRSAVAYCLVDWTRQGLLPVLKDDFARRAEVLTELARFAREAFVAAPALSKYRYLNEAVDGTLQAPALLKWLLALALDVCPPGQNEELLVTCLSYTYRQALNALENSEGGAETVALGSVLVDLWALMASNNPSRFSEEHSIALLQFVKDLSNDEVDLLGYAQATLVHFERSDTAVTPQCAASSAKSLWFNKISVETSISFLQRQSAPSSNSTDKRQIFGAFVAAALTHVSSQLQNATADDDDDVPAFVEGPSIFFSAILHMKRIPLLFDQFILPHLDSDVVSKLTEMRQYCAALDAVAATPPEIALGAVHDVNKVIDDGRKELIEILSEMDSHMASSSSGNAATQLPELGHEKKKGPHVGSSSSSSAFVDEVAATLLDMKVRIEAILRGLTERIEERFDPTSRCATRFDVMFWYTASTGPVQPSAVPSLNPCHPDSFIGMLFNRILKFFDEKRNVILSLEQNYNSAAGKSPAVTSTLFKLREALQAVLGVVSTHMINESKRCVGILKQLIDGEVKKFFESEHLASPTSSNKPLWALYGEGEHDAPAILKARSPIPFKKTARHHCTTSMLDLRFVDVVNSQDLPRVVRFVAPSVTGRRKYPPRWFLLKGGLGGHHSHLFKDYVVLSLMQSIQSTTSHNTMVSSSSASSAHHLDRIKDFSNWATRLEVQYDACANLGAETDSALLPMAAPVYEVYPFSTGGGLIERLDHFEPISKLIETWQAAKHDEAISTAPAPAAGRGGTTQPNVPLSLMSPMIQFKTVLHNVVAEANAKAVPSEQDTKPRGKRKEPAQTRALEDPSRPSHQSLKQAYTALLRLQPSSRDVVNNALFSVGGSASKHKDEAKHGVFMCDYFWKNTWATYCRSLAVGSALCHVLGIGDRHPGNILIDSYSGMVAHVDLSLSFGEGELLRFPEKVPFRMTPILQQPLGVYGSEGGFAVHLERSLHSIALNTPHLQRILEMVFSVASVTRPADLMDHRKRTNALCRGSRRAEFVRAVEKMFTPFHKFHQQWMGQRDETSVWQQCFESLMRHHRLNDMVAACNELHQFAVDDEEEGSTEHDVEVEIRTIEASTQSLHHRRDAEIGTRLAAQIEAIRKVSEALWAEVACIQQALHAAIFSSPHNAIAGEGDLSPNIRWMLECCRRAALTPRTFTVKRNHFDSLATDVHPGGGDEDAAPEGTWDVTGLTLEGTPANSPDMWTNAVQVTSQLGVPSSDPFTLFGGHTSPQAVSPTCGSVTITLAGSLSDWLSDLSTLQIDPATKEPELTTDALIVAAAVSTELAQCINDSFVIRQQFVTLADTATASHWLLSHFEKATRVATSRPAAASTSNATSDHINILARLLVDAATAAVSLPSTTVHDAATNQLAQSVMQEVTSAYAKSCRDHAGATSVADVMRRVDKSVASSLSLNSEDVTNLRRLLNIDEWWHLISPLSIADFVIGIVRLRSGPLLDEQEDDIRRACLSQQLRGVETLLWQLPGDQQVLRTDILRVCNAMISQRQHTATMTVDVKASKHLLLADSDEEDDTVVLGGDCSASTFHQEMQYVEECLDHTLDRIAATVKECEGAPEATRLSTSRLLYAFRGSPQIEACVSALATRMIESATEIQSHLWPQFLSIVNQIRSNHERSRALELERLRHFKRTIAQTSCENAAAELIRKEIKATTFSQMLLLSRDFLKSLEGASREVQGTLLEGLLPQLLQQGSVTQPPAHDHPGFEPLSTEKVGLVHIVAQELTRFGVVLNKAHQMISESLQPLMMKLNSLQGPSGDVQGTLALIESFVTAIKRFDCYARRDVWGSLKSLMWLLTECGLSELRDLADAASQMAARCLAGGVDVSGVFAGAFTTSDDEMRGATNRRVAVTATPVCSGGGRSSAQVQSAVESLSYSNTTHVRRVIGAKLRGHIGNNALATKEKSTVDSKDSIKCGVGASTRLLIQSSVNIDDVATMYPGWAAWI